jgi:light-regulated signal transduction histidine kinase (bacteriophytochrome)
MDVHMSMSVAILVGSEKKLWGLMVAHHTKAKKLSFQKRMICGMIYIWMLFFTIFLAMLGRLASMQLENAMHRNVVLEQKEQRDLIESMKSELSKVDIK